MMFISQLWYLPYIQVAVTRTISFDHRSERITTIDLHDAKARRGVTTPGLAGGYIWLRIFTKSRRNFPRWFKTRLLRGDGVVASRPFTPCNDIFHGILCWYCQQTRSKSLALLMTSLIGLLSREDTQRGRNKKAKTERKKKFTAFHWLSSLVIHFLLQCKTPLWLCVHLVRELSLPLELPLSELDTLSDLLMDLFVGSNNLSNICRIVLCLRLNGLVYMFDFSLGLLSNTKRISSRSIRVPLQSVLPRENVFSVAWLTRYVSLFIIRMYVSQWKLA